MISACRIVGFQMPRAKLSVFIEADGFAADGYLCVTPALFDRVKRGVELGYGPNDIPAGRDLRWRRLSTRGPTGPERADRLKLVLCRAV